MPMSDRLLACAGLVDGFEWEGDFDEFFLLLDGHVTFYFDPALTHAVYKMGGKPTNHDYLRLIVPEKIHPETESRFA